LDVALLGVADVDGGEGKEAGEPPHLLVAVLRVLGQSVEDGQLPAGGQPTLALLAGREREGRED
jgi:hypothetical protein